MNSTKKLSLACALLGLAGVFACGRGEPPSAAALSTPQPTKTVTLQGFETDLGDWKASQAMNRVAAGQGTLHLAPAAGGYYAEIQNQHDGYLPGYGDGAYSYFGGKGTTYQGDFYQAIDVYLDVTWAPPSIAGADGFFVDMAPDHADPNNYGAEHTFYVHATGSQLTVRADTNTVPFTTITKSGWYTFLVTFQKGVADDEPVVSQMLVLDAQKSTVGSYVTAALHDAPTRYFTGADLLGSGYVWITGWPNGFANDVLAIDNVETALLPYP
jgi:hypothetical protein